MIATRSPIVQLGIRAASPLALMIAIFLFFAGHNRPGGGFAAGLVLAAVVALRTVAGMPPPIDGVRLLAIGGVVASAVAIAPMLGGEVLLDQVVVDVDIPLLGKVKTGSSLIFDAGVTLIVVGLAQSLLDGLGAGDMAESAPSKSGVPS